MKHFIPNKVWYLKIAELAVLTLVFGGALWWFDTNQDLVFNVKPYHVQMYGNILWKKITGDDDMEQSQGERKAAEIVPVLLYHGISNHPKGFEVDIEKFINQMFALKKAGYQTVTLEDMLSFSRGEKELPEKSFLLTFDDGRKDSYYPVDPVLKALDYNAVMFVITSTFGHGSDYYLSTRELEKMLESGSWDIQSHTRIGQGRVETDASGMMGNFFANKKWLADKGRLETDEEFSTRIREDFLAAKNDLEQTLGNDEHVMGLAYPYGDFGQRSLNYPEAPEAVREITRSIYPISFYQVDGEKSFVGNVFGGGESLMRRVEVDPHWEAGDLLHILGTGEAKELPVDATPRGGDGWKTVYGSVKFGEEGMALSAKKDGSGSGVFLDGTQYLRDYFFRVDAHWKKGEQISLLARYQDENNHVRCGFSESLVKIETVSGGERKTVHEVRRDMSALGNDVELGMDVSGDSVSCLVGNDIVAQADVSGTDRGGAAIKTWDPEENNSSVLVKHVWISENMDPGAVMADPFALKSLPYAVRAFDGHSPWVATWGTREFLPNASMLVSAAEDSTGALAFLGGSREWKDYSFSTDFMWKKGKTVSLLARYKDNRNYVAFTLSDEYFRMEVFRDGERTLVEEASNHVSWKGKEVIARLDARGGVFTGFVGSDKVVQVRVPEEADGSGGIGLKVWDAQEANSAIEVKRVSVEGL